MQGFISNQTNRRLVLNQQEVRNIHYGRRNSDLSEEVKEFDIDEISLSFSSNNPGPVSHTKEARKYIKLAQRDIISFTFSFIIYLVISLFLEVQLLNLAEI